MGIFYGSGNAQERGRWDPVSYLKGLDSNQNGKLDPSEVSGRTAGFLRDMGFDTKDSISIDRVIEKIEKDRGEQSRRDDRSNSRSSKDKETLKTPTFGAVSEPVPSFGTGQSSAIESMFSTDVIDQVNQTLREYDRNKDQVLDEREIGRGRWGNPSPKESDTNGDGKLSRIELMNRYRARELYQRDNDDNRDRGDDRSSRGDQRNREDGTRSRYSSDRYSSDRGASDRGASDRGSYGNSSSYQSRSSSSSGGSSSTNSSSSDDREKRERYASYADSLIKQYDKDSDGKLSKEEIGNMRRPPKNADGDGDGIITKDELVVSLSGGATSSAAANSGSASSPESGRGSGDFRNSRPSYSTRSSRSSGSFGGMDINENNQIEMHEFSSDWDDDKIAEFYAKDKNGDGVITLKEWSEK